MFFKISKICLYISRKFSFITNKKRTLQVLRVAQRDRAATNPSPPFFPFPAATRILAPRNRAESAFNFFDNASPRVFHQENRRHAESADRLSRLGPSFAGNLQEKAWLLQKRKTVHMSATAQMDGTNSPNEH